MGLWICVICHSICSNLPFLHRCWSHTHAVSRTHRDTPRLISVSDWRSVIHSDREKDSENKWRATWEKWDQLKNNSNKLYSRCPVLHVTSRCWTTSCNYGGVKHWNTLYSHTLPSIYLSVREANNNFTCHRLHNTQKKEKGSFFCMVLSGTQWKKNKQNIY